MNDDNEYIFTFGFGHQLEGRFFVIQAESAKEAKEAKEARDYMFKIFGSKWSMQYDAPNAREKAGVEKFGLLEVK